MKTQQLLEKVNQAIREWREESEKRGENPSGIVFFSSKNEKGRSSTHTIFGEPAHVVGDLDGIYSVLESWREETQDTITLPPPHKAIVDAVKRGKNVLTAREIPKKFGGGTKIKTIEQH